MGYENTWAAIGIPGNLVAGKEHLVTGRLGVVYRNTWAAIGIPGNLGAGSEL